MNFRRRDTTRQQPAALAAVFVLGFLLVHAGLVAAGISPVLRGELVDTDSYTWANRAERLLTERHWFDGTEPRSNAPYGEASHWTRPLDVLVVTASFPLIPFMGTRAGVFLVASVLPVLLALGLCVSIVWLAAPIVPVNTLPLVAIAAFAQPLAAQYSLAGRLDHHLLIVGLFCLTAGAVVRGVASSGGRRWGTLAGIAAGLGLWVSMEFLATLFAIFFGLGVLWLVSGKAAALFARRMSVALAVTVACAALLEHGTGLPHALELDRIGLPSIGLAVLTLLFWSGLATDRIAGIGRLGRAAIAAVASLVVVGMMAFVFPGFIRGPFAGVEPETRVLWLAQVSELHPLLSGPDGPVGRVLYFVGPALVALPWSVLRIRAERRRGEGSGHVLYAILLGVFLALAFVQIRWSLYVQGLAAIGLAGAVGSMLRRIDGPGSSTVRSLARVSVIAVAFSVFPLAGWLLSRRPGPSDAGPAVTGAGCSISELVRRLPPAGPRAILAFMDFGPELLYRTPHSVVATPYHRNPGIVASHRILTAPWEEARSGLEARAVEWILLCPTVDRAFFGSPEASATESLYDRLSTGRPPEGIRALALEGPGVSGFLLYEMAGPSRPRSDAVLTRP